MAEIQSLASDIVNLTESLSWWNKAVIVMMVVAALAATGLVVTQWIAIKRAELLSDKQAQLGAAKDEQLARELKEKDGLIAEANTKSADANKQAATANERAENARLEAERLKKLVVWRSISAEQRKILVRVLSTRREHITLMVVANDPEAFVFASQLTTVFNDAKWGAFAEAASWGNLLPENLILPGPENETVRLLRSAFSAAGIPFTTDNVRNPDTSIVFPQKEQPTARVIVGSRIGPFK